ncbi:ankyrin repeat-containing domain protein [Pyronema omphalodes]|nr:ankyrin repeat-containing domain protein [Pyronema omphalodes]
MIPYHHISSETIAEMDIPLEIVLEIGRNSPDLRTMAAFCQVNSFFRAALTPELLRRGAEIASRTRCHLRNPAYWAIRYNQVSVLEGFLRHGLRVNDSRPQGYSFLHQSVGTHAPRKTSDTRIAQLLLKHGADVNRRAKLQRTPLFTAIYSLGYRHPIATEQVLDPWVALLLENGAQTRAVDEWNLTPVTTASMLNNWVAATAMLNYGGSFNRIPRVMPRSTQHEELVRRARRYWVNMDPDFPESLLRFLRAAQNAGPTSKST